MKQKTFRNDVWEVYSDTPINVLLLKNGKEYYFYTKQSIGKLFIASEQIEIFDTEIEVLQYIANNDLTKCIMPEMYNEHDTD